MKVWSGGAAPLLALSLLAPSAAAGSVGASLPETELQFAATEATSLDDFTGRALLIEFFAYW